jgi:hypothetical protein
VDGGGNDAHETDFKAVCDLPNNVALAEESEELFLHFERKWGN